MRTSDKIGDLTKALSAAQGEFQNPERNRTVKVTMKSGGSYTFDYATFDAILAGTRPILAKHGLAVVQGVSAKPGVVTVTTRLAHESGEWVEDEISGGTADDSLQGLGSACTYLKRYSYTAMLNIAAEEDDDGSAGSGHDAETSRKESNLPACPKCGTNKSVIVGKPEYGGGYLCFAKMGGCGEKWQAEPAAEEPKGTRTAKADAKKKAADELAAQTGLTTADKLPELTEVEKHQIAELRDALPSIKSPADYKSFIEEHVRTKSPAVQLAMSPFCLKRREQLDKPQGTSA